MLALEVLIGCVLGLVVFFLVIVPLLEKYDTRMTEWYDKYLDKWKKK